MAITLVNPEGLPKVDIYRQVSVATGSKLIFVAGQIAWDTDGRTVGLGGLATQLNDPPAHTRPVRPVSRSGAHVPDTPTHQGCV